jgi:hypothetical protein
VRMVGPHDNHSILLCDAADEVPPTPSAHTSPSSQHYVLRVRARMCACACACGIES